MRTGSEGREGSEGSEGREGREGRTAASGREIHVERAVGCEGSITLTLQEREVNSCEV